MLLLNPENVKWVVLHCSASHYGDVETIESWHKERGWSGCGYHWVITNCYPKAENYKLKQPSLDHDGLIHPGRSEKFTGAHVRGHNYETIGVVIIGAGGEFSSRQLVSTAKVCNDIFARFENCIGIKGHYEFTDKKTCPEIDIEWFKSFILPLGMDHE